MSCTVIPKAIYQTLIRQLVLVYTRIVMLNGQMQDSFM